MVSGKAISVSTGKLGIGSNVGGSITRGSFANVGTTSLTTAYVSGNLDSDGTISGSSLAAAAAGNLTIGSTTLNQTSLTLGVNLGNSTVQSPQGAATNLYLQSGNGAGSSGHGYCAIDSRRQGGQVDELEGTKA
jgi:hypothetical protein